MTALGAQLFILCVTILQFPLIVESKYQDRCMRQCKIGCRFGFVDTCPRCICAPDPCRFKDCKGLKCETVEKYCHYKPFCPHEAICISDVHGLTNQPSECRLPASTGPCFAAFRRYFFNTKTGQCQRFTYGGCMGNKNNFRTKQECEIQCNQGFGHKGWKQ